MSDTEVTLITIVLMFWTVIWLLLKWWKFLWGRIFKFVRRIKTDAELAIFTYKFERKDSARRDNADAGKAAGQAADGGQAAGTAEGEHEPQHPEPHPQA